MRHFLSRPVTRLIRMPANGILRFTFFISILVHGAVLLYSSGFNPFSGSLKKQNIEVRYVKKNVLKESPSPKAISEVNRPSFSPGQISSSGAGARVSSGGRVVPPYQEQRGAYQPIAALQNKPLDLPKPAFGKSELIAIKRKIALPAIEMAKIDNPSYITYYQIVREKIRRSAYQNYTHNRTGEVYISFIISNDGYVKDVRLVEDRTTGDDYLKEIALKSVKSASPFPNFPKELDYPQLSFNIIISFEIE